MEAHHSGRTQLTTDRRFSSDFIELQLSNYPTSRRQLFRAERTGTVPPLRQQAVGKTVPGSVTFMIRATIGFTISISDGSTPLTQARAEFGYTIRTTVGCGATPPPIHGFTFIPFPVGDTFSSAKAFTKLIPALGQR